MHEKTFLDQINNKIAKIAIVQEKTRQANDESFIKWLEKEHAKFNDSNAKSYGWLASMIEIPVR